MTNAPRANGILVFGTESGCGKTVVTTGLACALKEEGFPVRAVKPMVLGSKKGSEAELAFISSISHTPVSYPVQFMEHPGGLASFGWAESLRVLVSGTDTTIAELPGSAATPLTRTLGSWKDNTDFGADLRWPSLIVASAAPDTLEKLILNAAYLTSRRLPVIGLVIVETVPDSFGSVYAGLPPESLGIALQERTKVPYLGCLGHSPSISVPRVNQGNLIKTTSNGLDLLPIIKALNLRLSV